MTVSADTLALLVRAGLTGQDLIDVVRSIENDYRKSPSSAAERQKRYRERQNRERDAVCDVTRDVTRDVTITPPLPLSSETKVSPRPPSKTQPSNPPHPPYNPPRSSKTEFDEWYAGYPHKVGRGAAFAKWPIARKKASLAELIAGRDRYIAGKPDDRPWCNPATWLHQERWLDQPGNVIPLNPATGPPSIADRIAADHAEARRLAFQMMDSSNG